jgi:hypothetical protein
LRSSKNHLNLVFFSFRENVTRAGVQNLLARFVDQPVTSMASFPDSSDSYNGDDVHCYLHERDEALGHHWEATRETERLEATLAAFQTAPATMEGESSATWAQLADSDARVMGETFRRNPVPLSFCFVVLFLMIPSLLITAPTEESEALQLVTNNATGPLNARGDLLAKCLLDIPVRAREIALHGVHLGAAVALTIAQVNSEHELQWLQLSFAKGDDHHELVEDFIGHTEAVVNTSSAEVIMNNVFFGL